MALKLVEQNGGVRLSIKAVPGASRDRIVRELGDALKVAVSAPPEGGKANRAIVALLAQTLGVAESRFSIVRGESSPRKDVSVAGVSANDVLSRIGAD